MSKKGKTVTALEIRDGFKKALAKLGNELKGLQEQAELDLHFPTKDEVKLGLASRQFRLLYRLVEDPHLWSTELGPLVVRPIIETNIVTEWLLQKDKKDLYEAYKNYGVGKRKLYMLHLEEVAKKDGMKDEDLENLLARLDAEVNVDRFEEFQEIDLGGNFAKKSIRDMANEIGKPNLYNLYYQPFSTEIHGEWGSLFNFDLDPCGNPIHRYHRLGIFEHSPLTIGSPFLIHIALKFAEESITAIFDTYNVSTEMAFETCHKDMRDIFDPS